VIPSVQVSSIRVPAWATALLALVVAAVAVFIFRLATGRKG
jgi:hypothetical protein